MEAYWLPDVQEIGKPDLIMLNSFFWVCKSSTLWERVADNTTCLQDLRYFTLRAQHFIPAPSPLHAFERPLTYSELAWHRSRVRDVIELVREKFPGVPVMWKTGA